ncbi:MAG: hypothetical protein COU63_02320 [Candidatus Pacebacteria bacterium CG10_big_fil_rev_8_21_14_0_10_36_11]|nr:hypothetical protein [Candidatus Pacearchaeota archaeon]OIP73591.1 MAG: hypothetical protein AUK08_03395 [Candidatus Pacebacteria bacterium CG2_30_36_39]PIR64828.1 MAG: hypothetical protein COU63_02320 [Candidatus Pacebacteria bacterium CG10_big_fil_rev_8_21_14_0_10_36_11]PJC42594.1 MAG: hypothetical protein CO040_03685 [Candidatus Pacebacteria bacterium CG_4_9_14_0_2_um_filter_36_8]
MLETYNPEIVNHKTEELIRLLREIGFTENIVPDGIIGNRIIVKLIGEFPEEEFNRRTSRLNPNIRIWPKWVATVADTTDQVKSIAYRYAKDPSFGLAL